MYLLLLEKNSSRQDFVCKLYRLVTSTILKPQIHQYKKECLKQIQYASLSRFSTITHSSGVTLFRFSSNFPCSFSFLSTCFSCFLVWKIGIIELLLESLKSIQFGYFDAVTAFLKSIFVSAYFSCKLLGLLFHPPLERMQENNNSR